MSVIKNIYFANVPGNEQEHYHLDLYLPEKNNDNLETHVKQDGTDTETEAELVTEVKDTVDVQNCENEDIPYEVIGNSKQHQEFSNEQGINAYHIRGKLNTKRSNNVCISEREADFKNGTHVKEDETFEFENRKLPLVLFVHGGGWRRGDRDGWKHYLYFDVNFLMVIMQCIFGTYSNIGRSLSNKDIACAVISYPLTEIGLPGIFIELFTSYLQSCLTVFITSIPFIGMVYFCQTVSSSHHFGSWSQIFQNSQLFLLKEWILFLMLTTNLIKIGLFSTMTRQYKLSKEYIRAMWIMLLALVIAISYYSHQNRLLYAVILTLVVTQYTILRRRLMRLNTTYKDQINVVAKALRWAKDLGKENGIFDTSRIYMMGHSAGGHLVSLTVLDDATLSTVECSSQDVKGVISLSGVYDLFYLQGPILRPLYLVPTFGNCSKTWMSASPIHLLKQLKSTDMIPKFLLMCAEQDLFLKRQSLRFSEDLQATGVDCHHIEIEGTNHFSIVTKFKRSLGRSELSVLKYVTHFINTGDLFDKHSL